MTPARVLVEQAIARGDSLDHIIDTLHVDASFIDRVMRRMDAVADPDDDEQAPWLSFPPGEPDVIAELLDAIVPTAPRADPDRITAVRDYAEAGLTDPQIAERLGTTPSAIANLRSRNGIESPRPRRRDDPANVQLVRQYAETGCTDREIGALLGRKTAAISKLRERHRIPAGKARRSAAA